MSGIDDADFTYRNSRDRDVLNASSHSVEQCFRRDYSRLVAMLARRIGARHIERIEDAVQFALSAALERTEQPRDPGAWLYRVAYNRVIQDIRQDAEREKILEKAANDVRPESDDVEAAYFAHEIRDDMLRILIVCCDEANPRESRLVFALKTLCGFSTAEIGARLFMSEANVHKRLARARERLRRSSIDIDTLPTEQLRDRLPVVREVLYLLFNEGYLSTRPDQTIRRELCEEALRLAMVLAEHPVGAGPETSALIALMNLHLARFGSRLDATGGLLLLEEQDRSRWDRPLIHLGIAWLKKSAEGNVFSRYHAEAGIAAEHCLAESYERTRWSEIADLYATLERMAPSPLHTLNRAVAVAEWRGATAGLAVLDEVGPAPWMIGSYLWDAVSSDLHRRCGHRELARQYGDRALESAPSDAVRDLLRRRFAR